MSTTTTAISPEQAKRLGLVLSRLGVDPQTIIKSPGKNDGGGGGMDEAGKPSNLVVEIAPEAIQAAKHFFEVGKIGANWYHDAHNTINAGFANEQDRVLFALLLASTSVQNEIYGNFIEAALIFNALKKDIKENPDLLLQFSEDENFSLAGATVLNHQTYEALHLFRDTKQAKITQVGAKFGNIKKIVHLFITGHLKKDVIRNVIAASVKPTPGMSFDRKNPLIRKLKIANYALTLIDPDFASTDQNPFNVVVDTWMFRIFYPENTKQGAHSKGKAMIDKLFGSEAAYANVAAAVSKLAAEAGVSPHVMQAALWTGIKKTWEGESADASNYIAAIEEMITRYDEFWKDVQAETNKLAAVVSKLDPATAAQYIRDRRADRMRKIQATNMERQRTLKKASASKPPQPQEQQALMEEFIRESVRRVLEEQVRHKMDIPLPDDLLSIAKLFKKSGKQFFLVGGSVRDALLGKEPKDFDLATDAIPDDVERILGLDPSIKVLPLGKSFGVIKALTPTGNEYEIATYRKDLSKGRRPDAVEFTDIKTDVARRDLTMNALFYDIENKEIVDYVGGIEDIKKGVVRTVGDPNERFDEDRLRILRALRFAGRMGHGLDPATATAIKTNNSLAGVSGERIRDEFLKGIKSAKSVPQFFDMVSEFNLWDQIFPGLKVNLGGVADNKNVPVLLALLLRDNDAKVVAGKLNANKYSSDEVSQVSYLVEFQKLSPENAFRLKRLFKSSKLKKDNLVEFSNLSGKPDLALVRAFNQFEPSITGSELQQQGFSGKDLGQEMERRETELFKKMLHGGGLHETHKRLSTRSTTD